MSHKLLTVRIVFMSGLDYKKGTQDIKIVLRSLNISIALREKASASPRIYSPNEVKRTYEIG